MVLDRDDKPVGDALVAVVPEDAPRAAAVVKTAANGSFTAQVPSGRYALTATAPGQNAAYHDVVEIAGDSQPFFTLRVGANGFFDVTGQVEVYGGSLPSRTLVSAARASPVEGDIFYVEADRLGRFALRLPPAIYLFHVEAEGLVARAEHLAAIDLRHVVLHTSRPAPPPAEVVAWIRRHAIPIASTDPDHPLGDLAPLRAIIGDAQVVGLGSAASGVHELQQIRHRLCVYLAAEMGFTLVALPTNWSRSFALDAYAAGGKGDSASLLADAGDDTWDTMEGSRLLRWARGWNAGRGQRPQLHLAGFGADPTPAALSPLKAYLGRVDSSPGWTGWKGRLPAQATWDAVVRESLSRDSAAEARYRIAMLGRDLEARRDVFIARSSLAEYRLALHQISSLVYAVELASTTGIAKVVTRERAMAENAVWLLNAQPRATRTVLLGHNLHIGRDSDSGFASMASRLHPSIRYCAIGLIVGQGAFLGPGDQPSATKGPRRELALGPLPAASLGAAFASAGLGLFALDLHHLPAGPVADWFSSPQPVLESGDTLPLAGAGPSASLSRRFDAVIFVARATPALPLPAATRATHGAGSGS